MSILDDVVAIADEPEERNENINRIGKFKISDHVIKNTDYDTLVEVMKNFIVIRCEHIFPNLFEYIAMSHLFEEVEEGMMVSEYFVAVTKKENGTHKITVQKIKKGGLNGKG